MRAGCKKSPITAAGSNSGPRPDSSDSKQKRPQDRTTTCSNSSGKVVQQQARSSTPSESPSHIGLSPGETRQEFIERKKREQRATWFQDSTSTFSKSKDDSSDCVDYDTQPAQRSSQPAADVVNGHKLERGDDTVQRQQLALSIARPRSALHSGDFRGNADSSTLSGPQPGSPYPRAHGRHDHWVSTSPTSPWYQPQLPAVPNLAQHGTYAGHENRSAPRASFQRQRAASYTAFPSSFGLQPTTSPLVNATNNSDSDGEHDRFVRPQSPDKGMRRRTFSPGVLRTMHPAPSSYGFPPSLPRALPNIRRDAPIPYQAHQPRRSMTSMSESAPYSVPQTPSARSRRPSMASESSPLQRAPMVGKYEESIIRGRMSSLPSRPLDFVAQIGVLGKGICKSSLRCPPHVTVPFPAVFYNYGSRPGSPNKSSEGPSPYVGMVDLDNLKPPVDPTHSKRKDQIESCENPSLGVDSPPPDLHIPDKGRKRRLHGDKFTKLLRAGPVGGYRIPEKGQLQIIIKNPNKTAVKLFLVPYDLSGMGPGQKTFLRQRSYSAGPIIDMPLSARRNLGTDRPEAALSISDDPSDRPILRYLIHINICCPSKGRFFLYKSIRVVFANRVPDGKEKLRQEIQLPEPRFSAWKSEQDTSKVEQSNPQHIQRYNLNSDPDPSLLFGSPVLDRMDGLSGSPLGPESRPFTFPVRQPAPIPSNTNRLPSSNGYEDVAMGMGTPPSPLFSRGDDHACRGCPPPMQSPTRFAFERLTREEYTNERTNRRTQSPRPGEGMLGLQLRELAGSRPSSPESMNGQLVS